jgi:hypothetical protein
VGIGLVAADEVERLLLCRRRMKKREAKEKETGV